MHVSKLIQLRNQANHLLTTYDEYKHSEDLQMRRKVHTDVDRFLMDNRETAMLLLIDGLNGEIELLTKKDSVIYKILATMKRT